MSEISPADYEWLISEAAVESLRLAESAKSVTVVATRLRRQLSASRVHLILQQVELRKRAAAKFSQAARMFFLPQQMEQATSEAVAIYKSARFPAGAVADLCCGIGGDTIGLAKQHAVCAFDRDNICRLLAQENVRVNAGLAVEVVQADVAQVAVDTCVAWHIDPDRRPTGRRTTDLQYYAPGASTIDRLLSRNEHGAVKLAPAATVPEHWQPRAHLEWIGHQRECKQLVASFGRLAAYPGQRAATVINNQGHSLGTVVGQPREAEEISSQLGPYLFEPHAAVRAAGLSQVLAEEQQLVPLGWQLPYFSGNAPLTHPALACFEILEQLPFDRKKVKAALRLRKVGRLTVKTQERLDPRQEIKRLKVSGEEAGCLFIFPHQNRTLAVLTRRTRGDESPQRSKTSTG